MVDGGFWDAGYWLSEVACQNELHGWVPRQGRVWPTPAGRSDYWAAGSTVIVPVIQGCSVQK